MLFRSVAFTGLRGCLYRFTWLPLQVYVVAFTGLHGCLYRFIWLPLQVYMVAFTGLHGCLYRFTWLPLLLHKTLQQKKEEHKNERYVALKVI